MARSRRNFLKLAALGGAAAIMPPHTASAAGTITDSAGRRVPVPGTVRLVFPAGPPAAIFLYMLAPDLIAGWPRPLYADEREFIAPAYVDLPVVGRLTGRGGSANLEAVLAMKPDLILDYGSMRPTFVSLADRVQAQTKIPYALIDGRFDSIPEAFRTVGRLVGRTAIAEQKAAEAERIMADLSAFRASLPNNGGPRVYYGRGADGLRTGSTGSINVELLKYAGARNVADEARGPGNLASVSLEQVLLWDPDVILTTERNFYQLAWRHPIWRTLRAVRARRVYLSPTLPFGWFDRPPSANRLIGLRWLLAVLYPDRFAAALERETRRFYKLYYHVDLTDAQLARVLEPGTRADAAGAR